MKYRLSFQRKIHPVEEIHTTSGSALEHQPIGKPISFISPIRMRTGQECVLLGGSGGYRVQISACFEFTFTQQYYVSGVVEAKEESAGVDRGRSFNPLLQQVA
jgi:hypothetical protein